MDLIKKLGLEKKSEVTNFGGQKGITDSYPIALCENAGDMLEALIDMCEDRCDTCRVFNPQHSDCPSCDDIEVWRKIIEKVTKKSWPEIKEMLK